MPLYYPWSVIPPGLASGLLPEWVPASSMAPRVTQGPSVGSYETSTNIANAHDWDSLDFDATIIEGATFELICPTDLTFTAIFHWTGTGSGTAVWRIAGRALADGDSQDSAFGTAISVTDTILTSDYEHESAATAAVTIAGTPVAGRLVKILVERNQGSLTADAKLKGVYITWAS